MTSRQRIKLKLLIEARRTTPKDFERSALGTFDCITDPTLVKELDRIEEQWRPGQGIGRLLSEVWNELQRERAEDAALARYNKLVRS